MSVESACGPKDVIYDHVGLGLDSIDPNGGVRKVTAYGFKNYGKLGVQAVSNSLHPLESAAGPNE